MSRRVRKAVFPVAGLGTRFLPATKAMPKEMLTVVDRPVIQYAVDEAREAGIEFLIFVTGRNKSVIADHFDIAYELEATLEARQKTAELKALREQTPTPGTTAFSRQQVPLGLGHAVWCARDLVGDEPFALLLPDMVMMAANGGRGCLAEMMELYQETGGNIIALGECAPEAAHRYGIVGVGEKTGRGFRITTMVEKPEPGTAPSNYYISGRYILQPAIFSLLANQERGAGGEIQLTDSMISLSRTDPFYGLPFGGHVFDCGSKAGFLAANVAFALEREDLRDSVLAELDAVGIAVTRR